MGVRIDFTGASAGPSEPLPYGDYQAEVTKFDLSEKAGESGYHYISVEFRCDKIDGGTQKAWANYSMSPKAIWSLKQLLVSAGCQIPEDGPFEFDEREILGQRVTVSLGKEIYNGRDKNVVNGTKPPLAWS